MLEAKSAYEKLTAREQAEFAEWYEARLPNDGPDSETEKLWVIEIERRLAEIDSGKVRPISGEQVMKELRRRLRA